MEYSINKIGIILENIVFRLDTMDARFDAVDARFSEMDEKMDDYARITAKSIGILDIKIDNLEHNLMGQIKAVHSRIDDIVDRYTPINLHAQLSGRVAKIEEKITIIE